MDLVVIQLSIYLSQLHEKSSNRLQWHVAAFKILLAREDVFVEAKMQIAC